MMSIKGIAKHMLSPVMCFRHGIKNREGYMYIGKHCKIVRPKYMTFGKNVSIAPYTMLFSYDKECKLEIGEGAEIGMFSRIACYSHIIIGKNVLTGPHVFIADHNHEYHDISVPIKKQGIMIKKTETFPEGGVKIGDGTWLGTGVVIAGTVTIGKQCVIGANSVVTKDIPDYCVAAGNPCRVIKQYHPETQEWERV